MSTKDEMKIGPRRLLLQGGIDLHMQAALLAHVLRFWQEDAKEVIEVLIDSGGGQGQAANMMADAIIMCRAPVSGIVVGECHSSAMIILQACDLRVAWPSASIMFHRFSLPQDTVVDDRTDSHLEATRRAFEAHLRQIQRRSRQPLAKLRKWADATRYWSAQEALEHGLVDKIATPPRKDLSALAKRRKS